MPKTPITVMVSSMEHSDEYPITSKTTGQELFDLVINKLGLSQVPLFGFQYTDSKGAETFLKLDKKILSQDVNKKELPIRLNFAAKFFPESVQEELTHEGIQRLFWLQIRKGVTTDEIYCPPELCVLFSAQTMQALHGDYEESTHGPGFIDVKSELPERVRNQHSLDTLQWEERIKNAWASLKGTAKAMAIMDYLTIAQDLEQYGVTYFEIHNKKGTKLWLGVHNLGMDIYEWHQRVTPRLGFPWAEIRNISFNDKKFTIKMVSKDAPDFKFYSQRFRQNKRILALCVGNHKFFVARRSAQAAGMMMQEDRATLEQKLRKTKAQLLKIRLDLESILDRTKLTREDVVHQEQEAAGLDKYKTMKKAQSGDTKRRIMDFEDLDEAEC